MKLVRRLRRSQPAGSVALDTNTVGSCFCGEGQDKALQVQKTK